MNRPRSDTIQAELQSRLIYKIIKMASEWWYGQQQMNFLQLMADQRRCSLANKLDFGQF